MGEKVSQNCDADGFQSSKNILDNISLHDVFKC